MIVRPWDLWGAGSRTKEKAPAADSAPQIRIPKLRFPFSKARLVALLTPSFPKILAALMVYLVVAAELQTSWLQAWVLAATARRITFAVEDGPSATIRFPQTGPYDHRLGYSKFPDFFNKLKVSDFEIAAQARTSWTFRRVMSFGFYPVSREKNDGGLMILDRDDRSLYEIRYPQHTYSRFEDIPPVVVKSLLFIENRELLDERYRHRNPSVEWDRLAKAVLDYGVYQVNSGHRLSGGSTLATQLEKIRHSPGGRTRSATDKLRQMGTASLRAYLGGEDTLAARRNVARDYINSIPLAAAPGYGEVNGLGDGLRAWFGADFESVNRVLASVDGGRADRVSLGEQARAYRQVLSLLLALNKPAVYLVSDRQALERRVDSYLRLLADAGIISPDLRDAALGERGGFVAGGVAVDRVPFAERKGTDSVRTTLLSMLGIDSLYDLDRLDLTVRTTLDRAAQQAVAQVLQDLKDPLYASGAGLDGKNLLSGGDPSQVIYSFTLYERGPSANLLRIQADNYNQPLNVNEGTKLELGSTAKLRTLITYLEAVAELHKSYSGMEEAKLRAALAQPHDALTRWAIQHLLESADPSLPAMLEAAMTRRYSASPGEAFFTGGGLHYFSNFDKKDNGRIMTVREAFQRSVNLVFIRLMRDVVHYHTYRLAGFSPAILEDRNHPARREYLERFADMEGRVFLGRFYDKYRGQSSWESLETLIGGIRATPKRLAVIYRSVYPEANLREFTAFLKAHPVAARLSDRMIQALYDEYNPEKFNLQDRGYLAGVHPLELWLLEYWRQNPEASLETVFEASARERKEVYQWLFKKQKSTQDQRIRIVLEADAFREIHKAWKRLGYPFNRLVPSYATAIGSSGDNPAALAELAGVIVNEGMRYPGLRIDALHFGEDTPYETVLVRRPKAREQVLPPVIASMVKRELVGVVDHGTGRRAHGSVAFTDGATLEVGGKTGTGDNRFETYDRAGRPIRSKVVNRTATFVFVVGDRFFGTVTAYVPGKEAAGYEFTSALPVQIFRHLVPSLMPVLARPAT